MFLKHLLVPNLTFVVVTLTETVLSKILSSKKQKVFFSRFYSKFTEMRITFLQKIHSLLRQFFLL